MAALLAAEAGAADEHPLEDVLVADGRSDDLAAGRPRRSSGGRRSRGPTRPARRSAGGRGPADRAPARRARHRRPPRGRSRRPRSAGPRPRRARSRRPRPRATTSAASAARGSGAAVGVDVHAVRVVEEDLDRWPRSPRGSAPRRCRPSRWRSPPRRAGSMESPAARPSRCSMYRSSRSGPGSPGRGVRRRRRQLLGGPDELLELVLDLLVELEAVLVEHLEAVVAGRVVRGRDHDPGRELAGPG